MHKDSERLSARQKALDLTNKAYQPLGYLKCQVSSDLMWSYAKERAKEQVHMMLIEIPMYAGNLNDSWRYWDEVREELETMA